MDLAPARIGEASLHVARMDSPLRRMRGLLGRPAPAPGTAVWITPCRSVHTAGMRYAIDVAFLDRHGAVCATHRAVRPWRLVRGGRTAHSVLELRCGEIDRLAIAPGQVLAQPQ